jgi:hypothetical protein
MLTPSTDFNVKIGSRQYSAKAKSKPDHPGKNGKQGDDGYEICRNAVGDTLNRCTVCLTLSDNFDDLVEPISSSV